MLKHEDATVTSGDRRKAWEELQEQYLKVTDETIRAKTAERSASNHHESRTRPGRLLRRGDIKKAAVEAMDEPMAMADWRFKGDVVQGFLPEYDDIKFIMYRDSTYDFSVA